MRHTFRTAGDRGTPILEGVSQIGLEVWVAFIVLILGLLALDLGVFRRTAHVIKLREAGDLTHQEYLIYWWP